MDFDEYQRRATETNLFVDDTQKEALAFLSMGFVGEAGEVINKIKKVVRDDAGELTEEKQKNISSELGDALWYLSQLARALNMPLSVIAQNNLDKITDRAERGVIKGDGDER